MFGKACIPVLESSQIFISAKLFLQIIITSPEAYLGVEKYRSNCLSGCLREPKNNGKYSLVFPTVVMVTYRNGCIYKS